MGNAKRRKGFLPSSEPRNRAQQNGTTPESNLEPVLWRSICPHIYATVLISIFSSATFGVLWAILHNDVSGAFTISSYIIAVASLIVVVLLYQHGEACVAHNKRLEEEAAANARYAQREEARNTRATVSGLQGPDLADAEAGMGS